MKKYIELQYFGNIIYYNILIKNNNYDVATLNWYEKGWYGNKTTITGSTGLIDLSVPLLGGRNQKTILKDVKISYAQPWQANHKKAIKSCYGNSPYFDFFFYKIENLFQIKKEYLIDLNLLTIETILSCLKESVSFNIDCDGIISNAEIIMSKQYCKQNNCNSTLKYPQVFEDRMGFTPNLSILDLLFCTGKQAKDLLKM